MRVLAWVALLFALASLAISALIVLSSPDAMMQVRTLDFPLTGLGESVIAMFLPILLSTASCVVGVATLRRKLGRVAMIVAVLSWLLLWAILGVQGFHYLF